MEEKHLSSLEDFCRAFIRTHNISCAESIYQQDSVTEGGFEFIEGICERVGYLEDEE